MDSFYGVWNQIELSYYKRKQHYIHPPLIRRVYADCSPLFQLIELINTLKANKNDTILEKN